MNEELLEIFTEEKNIFEVLYKELKKQNEFIVKDNIFGMESCVDKIQSLNKNIAAIELKRRQLTGQGSLKTIVLDSNNSKLESEFKELKNIISEVKIQKDCNEILLKQGLSFTTRLLSALGGGRNNSRTYGSTGAIRG